MSESHEILGVIADTVDENTSDDGIDVVNVYATLFEAMRENPEMTIEEWETLRLAINNSAAIACNLIDQEIAHLKAKKRFQMTVAKGMKEKDWSNVEIANVMGISESTVRSLLEEEF